MDKEPEKRIPAEKLARLGGLPETIPDPMTPGIFVTQDQFRRHRHQGREDEKLDDGLTTLHMSFETGEQTATKVYFPFPVEILRIRGIVMKALGATDTGTITGANADGNSTGGVITGAISAALNTEYVVTPTTNNIVGKDSYYKLTSAKTTAGGRMLVSLEWVRLR